MVALVVERAKTLKPHERIMIFCSRISHENGLIALANAIEFNEVRVSIYYSDYAEKDSDLNMWMTGRTQVMVCTSSMGPGVDKKGVVAVYHHGPPHSFSDYLQETGRGGRSGGTAHCVTLTPVIDNWAWKLTKDLNCIDRLKMVEFLHDRTTCRRRLIARWFDGEDPPRCNRSKEQLCDVCELFYGIPNQHLTGAPPHKDPPHPVPHLLKRFPQTFSDPVESPFPQHSADVRPETLWQEAKAKEAAQYHEWTQYLHFLQHRCAYCFTRGQGPVSECNHTAVGCSAVKISFVEAFTKGVVKQMGEYAGCTICLAPQSICPGYQACNDCRKKSGRTGCHNTATCVGPCPYGDVIPRFLVGALEKPSELQKAISMMREHVRPYVKRSNDRTMITWLGNISRLNGYQVNNAFRLFGHLMEFYGDGPRVVNRSEGREL